MRYPGGKSFIANKIMPYFKECINNNTTFVDVFAGGLTMTVAFAKAYPEVKKYWINDKDPAIACIWDCYINWKPNLKTCIRTLEPTVSMFYKNKKVLADLNEFPNNTGDIIKTAVKKIMIHQCSYSGLGLKGGAQGGIHQSGHDRITTNWNPEFQNKKINEFEELFKNCFFKNDTCTNLDYSEVIKKADEDCLLYLDPPYYEKGKQLYFYYFDDVHHIKLANDLKNTNKNWVLSYDDCDFIRNLYNWAKIDVITNDNRLRMLDTNVKRKANTKNELIITPK
jgi:DNA adenine methylase